MQTTAEGHASVVGAAGFPWDYWVFDPVPERKRVKNRVHWDVDLTGPDATALIAAGAMLLREPDETVGWWVLADPEGNEFCAFAPRRPA
ncbi:VOC family protein [Micromonospora sp. 4G55]|uniref:VOC family protein n=1 Tax=Micromonospora sp. 4G55 TaxID=2806102 RepID=UPI001EE4311D|nr:VOC family protein [Micromonospora sp. 4G55]